MKAIFSVTRQLAKVVPLRRRRKGKQPSRCLPDHASQLQDSLGTINDRLATHKHLDGTTETKAHLSKKEVSKHELLKAAAAAQRHLYRQRTYGLTDHHVHEVASRLFAFWAMGDRQHYKLSSQLSEGSDPGG
jgi:hypothetical protein